MITPLADVPNLADVAAHYDDLDDLYLSVWGSNVHHGYWLTGKETSEEAVINLTHLVAQRASIRPGDRVCDLGCGYGATALTLNRDYGAVVTGLTIAPKQYQQAKRAAAKSMNVNFLLCDALQNDLAAAGFDAVIAVESSEHIADKQKLFSEAFRLLRPGGRLVVAAWLTREQPHGWECKYLLEPICAEGRLPSMASAMEYQTMLEYAGFRELEFTELTHRVQKTWSICAARFIKRLVSDRALRRRLLDPEFTNRVFAKTVFRIWLAYQTGAMRYGVFSAFK
jgi:tocopherol O-methyltransferase